MPALRANNNKFQVRKLQSRTLATMIVATTLSGCVAPGKLIEIKAPIARGPGAIAEKGLSLAVWLEDQCESEERDAETLTVLEGFHDGLTIPMEMLSTLTAVAVAGAIWSLYDRLTLPASEPLPDRPGLIMAYVMPHRAGPTMRARLHGYAPVMWFG